MANYFSAYASYHRVTGISVGPITEGKAESGRTFWTREISFNADNGWATVTAHADSPDALRLPTDGEPNAEAIAEAAARGDGSPVG